MNSVKTLLAATSVAALCGAAQAQDVRVHCVPTFSHAGQANYGFACGGQSYVIPQNVVVIPAEDGSFQMNFGYIMQANKVEKAKMIPGVFSGYPIDFLADTSQIITVHGGNQGFLAHDIDP